MAKSINEMSFDDAFKTKRRELGPGKTFTWQGEKYTTDKKDDSMDDLTPRGNLPSSEDDATEGGPTQRNTPRNPPKRKGIPLPSDRATGYRSQVKETGMTPDERSDAVGKFALGAASLLPAGRVVRGAQTAVRRYGIGRNYEALSEGQRRAAANAANLAARPRPIVDGMKSGGSVEKFRKGGIPDLTGDGKVTRADVLKGRGVFKHGGSTKKYAAGGSVSSASKRADGCATKGKTRGKMV
jgi:hypothetical protein